MSKSKAESGLKKNDAVIEDAKIYSIYDLWTRKPRGLGFCDTNALVVTAKTKGGEKITETFYTCVRPNNTFTTDTLSSRSRFRREKLARFLEHYNITGGVEEWKGKKVDVVMDDGGHIFVPPRSVVTLSKPTILQK